MAGLGLALLAALLSIGLAGCGFGSPASSTGNSQHQQDQQKAQALMSAMQTCMRRAGYTFVGPPSDDVPAGMVMQSNGTDSQTRDDPAYKAAYDRCAASTGFKQFASRQGAGHQPSAQEIEKANQQILKLYACLRQKGWTLADPTRDSHGGLTPPQPPSDVHGNQARTSQFGNDMNSCSKAAGMNGLVTTNGGGGAGNGSGSLSAGGR